MKWDFEQKVLSLYQSNLFDVHSINQIATLLKKKYPFVNKKVSDLVQEGVLTKIPVGRAHLCMLNLASEKTILLLALNELAKKQRLDPKTVSLIDEAIGGMVDATAYIEGKGRIVVVSAKPVKLIVTGYLVSSITYEQFEKNLLESDKPLTDFVVIRGYETFYRTVAKLAGELKQKHNPLMRELGR